MSEINKWDIWLARVPYEDMSDEKVRPVLVMEDGEICVLAYKMTTHEPRRNFSGEYAMVSWKKAGLNCQTTIRTGKKLRLEHSRMIRKIGTLQAIDIAGLMLLIRKNGQ